MANKAELDLVFGSKSKGRTPEKRARNSDRMWVRSQDMLASDSPGATGLKLTSEEALEIFGFELLKKCIEDGGVVIAKPCEPMVSLIMVSQRLGLSQYEVAKRANTSLLDVMNAENYKTRTDMKYLVIICKVLGLDPRRISFESFE